MHSEKFSTVSTESEVQLVRCLTCRRPVAARATRCGQCGTRLTGREPKFSKLEQQIKMKQRMASERRVLLDCPRCKQKTAAPARTCRYCGTLLSAKSGGNRNALVFASLALLAVILLIFLV